jgi:hypothetical protein
MKHDPVSKNRVLKTWARELEYSVFLPGHLLDMFDELRATMPLASEWKPVLCIGKQTECNLKPF